MQRTAYILPVTFVYLNLRVYKLQSFCLASSYWAPRRKFFGHFCLYCPNVCRRNTLGREPVTLSITAYSGLLPLAVPLETTLFSYSFPLTGSVFTHWRPCTSTRSKFCMIKGLPNSWQCILLLPVSCCWKLNRCKIKSWISLHLGVLVYSWRWEIKMWPFPRKRN